MSSIPIISAYALTANNKEFIKDSDNGSRRGELVDRGCCEIATGWDEADRIGKEWNWGNTMVVMEES